MGCVVELLDVQSVAFELDDGAFVVVNITVVRSREDSNDYGKLSWSIPFVHLIAIELSFMGSDY